ncbi:GNAT family N-acetyltransferase [Billgrantia sp. C5P2]|uniref:GNAT family N-acetyltransferase n=1 Tax=Billgrantia sp. C5P2 TaxID=3436239 RepID=UPI003DA69806
MGDNKDQFLQRDKYSFQVSTEEDGWRRALQDVGEYDCYHTWDFHELSRKNREGSPLLFTYKGRGGVIVWPLLLRSFKANGRQWKDLTSTYGYPGPLTKGGVSDFDKKIWSRCIERWCGEHGIVSIFARLNPFLDTASVLTGLGEIRTLGDTVPIDLRESMEGQRLNYRNSLKRGIKKLEKMGAECREVDSESYLDEFMAIYKETMSHRGAKEYYFFGREYCEALFSAKDFSARMYGVFIENRMVCAGIFMHTGKFVQYHLGGTLPGFYRFAPSKLLHDKVRIYATEQGAEWLMLGGGVGGCNDELMYFKTGFSPLKLPYKVVQIIIDPGAYEKLEKYAAAVANERGMALNPHFFPSYRSVKDVVQDYA